jgi:hypothetical protein
MHACDGRLGRLGGWRGAALEVKIAVLGKPDKVGSLGGVEAVHPGVVGCGVRGLLVGQGLSAVDGGEGAEGSTGPCEASVEWHV